MHPLEKDFKLLEVFSVQNLKLNIKSAKHPNGLLPFIDENLPFSSVLKCMTTGKFTDGLKKTFLHFLYLLQETLSTALGTRQFSPNTTPLL